MHKSCDYFSYDYDYVECDSEYEQAAKLRGAEGSGVESLYDREIRIRVGEWIARSMQTANKREP